MKVTSLRTWHYLHVAINSSTPKPLGSYQKKREGVFLITYYAKLIKKWHFLNEIGGNMAIKLVLFRSDQCTTFLDTNT